jgi:hypothetical protein
MPVQKSKLNLRRHFMTFLLDREPNQDLKRVCERSYARSFARLAQPVPLFLQASLLVTTLLRI